MSNRKKSLKFNDMKRVKKELKETKKIMYRMQRKINKKVMQQKNYRTGKRMRLREGDGDLVIPSNGGPDQVIDNTNKTILGESGPIIDSTQSLPQVNVVTIQVPLNAQALIELSYSWAVYAVSRNVLVNQTVQIGTGGTTVGIHWFMAYVICYDLWNATKDNITIFSAAPLAYWELRAAIAPKVSKTNNGGFGYNFTSPDVFDDFLPGGVFPLAVDTTSLAWIVAEVGERYPVITAPIPVDDVDLQNSGPQVVQKIWTELKKAGANFDMIEPPQTTAFTYSTAAFCAGFDYSTVENRRWTLFSHESKINGWEHWLALLGLGFTTLNTSDRRGPNTFTDYYGPYPYNHRIIEGKTGRQVKQIIRFKNIYMEEFLAAVLGTLTVADVLQSNGMGNVFDNDVIVPTPNTISQLPESAMTMLSGVEFLMGNLQALFKAFSFTGWVAFANKICETCRVCGTGTLQVPTQEVLTMAYPNFFNEMRASMVPVKNKKNGWEFNTYPVLVVGGKTRGNIYENTTTGSLDIITTQLEIMYPNMTVNPYLFDPSTGTTISAFDPNSFTNSWVQGTVIDPSITQLSNLCNRLQGNVMMSTPMANFHAQNTVLYYTKLAKEAPPNVDGWSVYQLAKVLEISNRVPFSSQDVSYDLMNILPTSFMAIDTYQPIYSETSSLQYSGTQTTVKQILQTVLGYPHEVAGEGTETSIANVSMVAQHVGGGFVNFMKTLGQSLLPVLDNVPVVGGMLKGLGGRLIDSIPD
jgi:hypothetical protein